MTESAESLFGGGSLRDDLERRAYPKLDRKKRCAVRRIFLYGLLHTDAMHYAIWGVNEIGSDANQSKGAEMEPAIPNLVSAQEAADSLGITVPELAQNLTDAIERRCQKMSANVRNCGVGDPDELDEVYAGIRRLFVSLCACWAAIDAPTEASKEGEPES